MEEKSWSVKLTQALRGDAKMAFQQAGKGCLKPLSGVSGHLSIKKSGRVMLWVLAGRGGQGKHVQTLAFYISWHEGKDKQGECEVLLKMS